MRPLYRWLLDPARAEEGPIALVAGLGDRLRAEGLPLVRMSLSVRTLHPEVWVRNLVWSPAGVAVNDRPHDYAQTPDYRGSPVEAIHQGGGPMRERLDGTRYPQLRALAAAGACDYLIRPIPVFGGERTYISYAIDRQFTEDELAFLEELDGPLGARVQLESTRHALRSLLRTYLGPNAAERVLAGAVQRGGGQTIRAAIWYCDLVGFTALSDARPAAEVVPLLDRYFEAVATQVVARGGEILKFVGDGMLAVFPIGPPGGPDEHDACRRALVAAEDGVAAVARAGLAMGVGLHLGEVMYGNIGGRDRLDFTVIGAAVNEVCRVEALCRVLGAPLLMTEAFARATGREDVELLGAHPLKGVKDPPRVARLR